MLKRIIPIIKQHKLMRNIIFYSIITLLVLLFASRIVVATNDQYRNEVYTLKIGQKCKT